MTAVNTIFLVLGMALVGVPVLLGLLSPIVGAAVVRLSPESAWDGLMLFVSRVRGCRRNLLDRQACGWPAVGSLPDCCRPRRHHLLRAPYARFIAERFRPLR